jgi:thiol-disulfide isomerase/thioredoxin
MKKVILVVSLTAMFGCNARRQPLKTGLEGKPLPAFNLLLNDSSTYINTVNIPAGKPVVLFYFSPRCPYCRAQMDDILKNISSLKDIRFYIFTDWPFQEMKAFYNYYQLNKYQNISVGVDYNSFFQKNFNAYGIPYTAIYRKDNKLNEAFMGIIDSKQIKESAEN